MSNIPTRVKRWLKTTNYVLVRRATVRTLVRLFNYVQRWLPVIQPAPTIPQHTDAQATLETLQGEIEVLKKMLSDGE